MLSCLAWARLESYRLCSKKLGTRDKDKLEACIRENLPLMFELMCQV